MSGYIMDLSTLNLQTQRIDHIAIAVKRLEESINLYTHVFGCKLIERRATEGEYSGMISAVLELGPFNIVLMEGTTPASQICQFIDAYGPGVQHVAIQVDCLETVYKALEQQGVEFATTIIKSPGLNQLFTKRDSNSGMMFEFIERKSNKGFTDNSVQQLFKQLEDAGLF